MIFVPPVDVLCRAKVLLPLVPRRKLALHRLQLLPREDHALFLKGKPTGDALGHHKRNIEVLLIAFVVLERSGRWLFLV